MTPGGPASTTAAPRSRLDAERLRRDFPILRREVNGRPLVYLDNAATAQKPAAVIEAEKHYYETMNANIHRGVHTLSVEATEAYERARVKASRFIGAARPEEIIFVRSATEAINLVAQAYARPLLHAGDEVLISHLEHHSNIVPWQLVCEQTGAKLRVVPISDRGEIVQEEYARLLGPKTRVVAMAHVSNALGTVNPLGEMIAAAKRRGAAVLIDGAQAAPHMPVNVAGLGCDFYAVTGHKMYGPTGIGVLYGRHELLEAMPPWQGGGEMILSVSFEKTTFNHVPHKFEAGTPHIAGAIGLGAAIDYLQALGMENVNAAEQELLAYATARLTEVEGLRLVGTAAHKAAILSFLLGDVHPHDIGTILDQAGIAVRTGHHCAQPVMERFGIAGTARASLGLYNTRGDIDRLVEALRSVREVFG